MASGELTASVTILGSGTAVPFRGRSSPGLVLAVESARGPVNALIDPSAGTLHRMAAAGFRLENLSTILVTHFHPDHTADIAPICFALRNPSYAKVGQAEPLLLAGPRGIAELFRRMAGVYGRWLDLGSRLEIVELDRDDREGFLKVAGIEVTWCPVEHSPEAIAYRFEARGRLTSSLCYSGDSDVCDGLIEAARGVETLIVDCAFPDALKVAGHLTPTEVGRIAAAAAVKRVVLTHLYPECQGEDLVSPVRALFSGDVVVAEDGFSINL